MLPEGLLTIEAVSIGEHIPSKKRTLEKAAALLSCSNDSPTSERIFEKLLERERLGSTGLAGGVALPHARMAGLEKCRGAFIRLDTPVDFDALDGQPVDLVFALLVPEEATQSHLQLLASLAQIFGQTELCERLRNSSAQEALDILMQSAEYNAA